MFWLCLRSPCADPSSETTTAAEGGGRIPAAPNSEAAAPSTEEDDPSSVGDDPPPRSWRWMPRETRRSTRGRRTRPVGRRRPWRCPAEPPPPTYDAAIADVAAPPRRRPSLTAQGFGRRIPGRQTGVWSSSNERSPRRRHCSPRRYRSAGVAATRQSPPKWRPRRWCVGGCRRGLCRRGGRDGGGVGGRRGRRQLNDAMAVPRGRDAALRRNSSQEDPGRISFSRSSGSLTAVATSEHHGHRVNPPVPLHVMERER
jgi:hypothetical protein